MEQIPHVCSLSLGDYGVEICRPERDAGGAASGQKEVVLGKVRHGRKEDEQTKKGIKSEI
jgi:hypothetical protein